MLNQRQATDRDEVDDLPSHVVRIPLPLPLTDLKVVNVYAILGGDGITLVDSGWADEVSEVVLVDALDRLGFAPGDVRRILVTHAHWDHFSRAIGWQRRYGTTVLLGRQEHHSIDGLDLRDGAFPAQARLLLAAGATELAQTIADLPFEPYERNVPFGPPDAWLEDGDEIDCGAITLVARATPGHTRGHMVYEDRDAALTFTGDHILPRITPSIALERKPPKLPLRSYLTSLRLFLELPDSRMLPAHGAVTPSVKARAEALLDHHRERLDVVHGLVAAGSHTAYDVSREMTWTRHHRTIDEMGAVHRMAAILEVAAHLDLLVDRGALSCEQSGPINHYVVA